MRKKIVIITPNFYPENFPINKFAKILENNFDLTVITTLPSYRNNAFFKGYSIFGPYSENNANINILRVPVIPRKSNKKIFILIHYISYFLSMFFFSIFFFLKKRNKINFILSYCLSPTFTSLFGIIGEKLSNAKHFNWVQDIWPEAIISSTNTNYRFLSSFVEIIQNSLLKNSELITQSNKMKKYFEKRFKKKIYLINNPPRNSLKFYSTEIKNKKTFSYFGNIGKAQKLEYFLDIFFNIKDVDYNLNIFGDGSEKLALKDLYKKKNINWFDYIDESKLIKEYEKTDFFLLPIDAIGRQKFILPGKFSTYLSFYKPIIGFSDQGTAIENEITQNGVGIFININETKEKNILKIRDLMSMENENYHNLSNCCKKLFENNFSDEAIKIQIKQTFGTY